MPAARLPRATCGQGAAASRVGWPSSDGLQPFARTCSHPHAQCARLGQRAGTQPWPRHALPAGVPARSSRPRGPLGGRTAAQSRTSRLRCRPRPRTPRCLPGSAWGGLGAGQAGAWSAKAAASMLGLNVWAQQPREPWSRWVVVEQEVSHPAAPAPSPDGSRTGSLVDTAAAKLRGFPRSGRLLHRQSAGEKQSALEGKCKWAGIAGWAWCIWAIPA